MPQQISSQSSQLTVASQFSPTTFGDRNNNNGLQQFSGNVPSNSLTGIGNSGSIMGPTFNSQQQPQHQQVFGQDMSRFCYFLLYKHILLINFLTKIFLKHLKFNFIITNNLKI